MDRNSDADTSRATANVHRLVYERSTSIVSHFAYVALQHLQDTLPTHMSTMPQPLLPVMLCL